MKRTKEMSIIILTLVMIGTLIPVCAADAATNEAIESLTISFTGSGNSTTVSITVGLNTVADANNALIVSFWIDEKIDANNLGETAAGATTFDTRWDITRWDEGYHTLIAELKNPGEIAYDNKADNRLDLPFCTQEWFWEPVGSIYGYAQYTISCLARQQANGTFSIFADFPIWLWGVLIAVILIAVVLWKRSKRRKRGSIRQYAKRPVYGAKNYYDSW